MAEEGKKEGRERERAFSEDVKGKEGREGTLSSVRVL